VRRRAGAAEVGVLHVAPHHVLHLADLRRSQRRHLVRGDGLRAREDRHLRPANNIFIGARVAAAAFTPAADVSNASMCSLWLPLGGHPLASALVTSMFEL
jgi:hypothetical protein